MKIDGNQLGGVPPESTISKTGPAGDAESTRRAARLGYRNSADAPSEAGPESTSSDEVALSGLGRELSRVDSDREARIEKLAGLYEQGRIEVDSEQVARKVVDDAFHETIEVERALDHAVELLLRPTLDNLRAVEELLRDAVVRMPQPAGAGIGRKVRLCGRLLDSAEAARPGGDPAGAYTVRGEQLRPRTARLAVEV